MSRTFFAIAAILVMSQLLPPQVRSVSFSYDKTEIEFWYPSLFQDHGEVQFGNVVRLYSPDEDVMYDALRDGNYLCGLTNCTPRKNDVMARWLSAQKIVGSLEYDLSVSNQRLAAISASIRESRDKISSIQSKKVSKKPILACETEAEATQISWGYCLIKYIGAKVCKDEVKDDLPSEINSSFRGDVANELCQVALNGILGDPYNLFDAVMVKYTSELGLTAIKEFAKWLHEDIGSGVEWGIAIGKTIDCVPAARQRCIAVANRWNNDFLAIRQEIEYEIANEEALVNAKLFVHHVIGKEIDRINSRLYDLRLEMSNIEHELHSYADGDLNELYVEIFGRT